MQRYLRNYQTVPLPNQYRDYPLALFMAIVVFVFGIAALLAEPLQSVEVTLVGDCCPAPRCPVIESLTALPDAQDVRHQVGADRSTITFRAGRSTSARQIWNAVEAVQHRPQRMLVDQREFTMKPIN